MLNHRSTAIIGENLETYPNMFFRSIPNGAMETNSMIQITCIVFEPPPHGRWGGSSLSGTPRHLRFVREDVNMHCCAGLAWQYPGKRAVDGVSFNVEPRLSVCYPNGAGKSTSFSMAGLVTNSRPSDL